MNKRESTSLVVILAGLIILITGSAFTGYIPGGTKGGYSGSPLDGKNCTYCHGGSSTTQSGIITSNIDSSGYIPGSTYTITVSVPGSGLKGFEVSPLNSANQTAGALTAGFENKLANSGKSITQSITSGSDPAVWSFNWTAPAKGTGIITFYGAFTAGKPHTLLSTMVVKEKNVSSLTTEISPYIDIRYNSVSKKLIFQSNNSIPVKFSAALFTIEGKSVKQIAEKQLSQGLNNWESDISGIEEPGILVLIYYLGTVSVTKKVFIF